MTGAITRRQKQIEELEDTLRVYTDGDLELPSVTEVIRHGEENRNTKGLEIWKKRNNGENGMPDHQEIFEYSQHRGTLVHYALLNPLSSVELWSDDEMRSLDALKSFGTYKYDEEEPRKPALDRYQQDLHWCIDRFERVKENLGISPDTTLDVEEYVFHTEEVYPNLRNVDRKIGYGGQYDLLYENPVGETVLADIKTSKRVYEKHKLQAEAYSHAIDVDVDRLQIIRLHPDHEWTDCQSIEISDDEEWSRSRHELWTEFKKRADNFYDKYEYNRPQ